LLLARAARTTVHAETVDACVVGVAMVRVDVEADDLEGRLEGHGVGDAERLLHLAIEVVRVRGKVVVVAVGVHAIHLDVLGRRGAVRRVAADVVEGEARGEHGLVKVQFHKAALANRGPAMTGLERNLLPLDLRRGLDIRLVHKQAPKEGLRPRQLALECGGMIAHTSAHRVQRKVRKADRVCLELVQFGQLRF